MIRLGGPTTVGFVADRRRPNRRRIAERPTPTRRPHTTGLNTTENQSGQKRQFSNPPFSPPNGGGAIPPFKKLFVRVPSPITDKGQIGDQPTERE